MNCTPKVLCLTFGVQFNPKIHRGKIQNMRVIYFIASNSWSQILFIPLTEG